MNNFTTILADLLLSFFLLPFIVSFYKQREINLIEIIIFSFGLSVGLGTLFIFYLMIIFPGFLNREFILSTFFLVVISTFIWRKKNIFRIIKNVQTKFHIRSIAENVIKWEGIIWLLIILFFAYILIDSLYKPLFEWDALARYVYWGHRMYFLKQIDNVEIQYPLLIPISLTYSFLMSGGYNDYLAKLIPALFSIFTVLATYLLGKKIFNGTVGLLAAFILANTPIFYIWTTRVYIDIPQTFYILLFTYSLYEYFHNRSNYYILSSGLFLALSLWSKQASAITYCSVLLLIIFSYINRRFTVTDKIINLNFKACLFLLVPSLVLVSFWYIRNFIISKELIWQGYLEAQRSILSFFPSLDHPDAFNEYLAPIYFLGIVYSVIRIFEKSLKGLKIPLIILGVAFFLISILNLFGHIFLSKSLGLFSRYFLIITSAISLFFFANKKNKITLYLDWKLSVLLIMMIPYYFLVWWNYSVEPRYWTPILPYLAILGSSGLFILFEKRFSSIETKLLIVFLAIAAFIPLSYKLLEHEFFLYPNRSDFDKKSTFVGGAYIPFMKISDMNLPTNSTIVSNDNRIGAFTPRQIIINRQPTTLTEVRLYDYFFLSPFTVYAYNVHESLNNEVLNNLDNNLYFDKIFELEDGKFAFYRIRK